MLAGGGSLGAVEVGMLEALLEAGVSADLVVGASVGAINGAHFAARPDRDGLALLRALWTSVRRRDVFPFSPLNGALSFLSLRNHLVNAGPLHRLLSRNLPFRDLREARIPLHLIAADALTGLEVLLSEGPVVEAVLASSAIPGVFPPIELRGRHLFDGGIASNTPIAAAVALGARRVVVLPTGHACRLAAPPASAIGMALHGLTLLIARQLMVDLERFADRTELRVVPPPCPIERSPVDFSRSLELIDTARASTTAWLAEGGLDAGGVPESLGPHAHAM
ncbi:MAG TPA: patatin-like phospholipase family protein [Myxococcota bacterium]|nr:patatin-like phospholipase family protein [Myxococcota bacterium]